MVYDKAFAEKRRTPDYSMIAPSGLERRVPLGKVQEAHSTSSEHLGLMRAVQREGLEGFLLVILDG